MTTWKEMVEKYKELVNRDVNDFIQHPSGGWYERTAEVTRSIIADGCLVLGKAIVDMCELKGQSIVKDNAKVTLSSLDHVSMIGGNAVADRCKIFGSNILDNAIVNVSAIGRKSTIRSNANIYHSTLEGKCLIEGSTDLSICYVYNSTVNIPSRAFLTQFRNDTFTDIPLTINNQLIGYNINVDKEKVIVGCTRKPIDWWKENASGMWKANFSCIKEEDIDKLIEAIKVIQEVYNGNLERND